MIPTNLEYRTPNNDVENHLPIDAGGGALWYERRGIRRAPERNPSAPTDSPLPAAVLEEVDLIAPHLLAQRRISPDDTSDEIGALGDNRQPGQEPAVADGALAVPT